MKQTIALFVYDPKCSVQSCNGVINALEDHYRIKIFSKSEVEYNFFDDVEMVVIPGGIGDSDSFDQLMKYNGKTIKKFVRKGGKYLGICMGAYWAGKHYLNILDDIEVVQYIKQPNTCTRRPHAKNMPVTFGNYPQNMFFYDGPTFIGKGLENCNIVGTYSNTGMPMALRTKNIGLIGCHPESQDFWYESYSWMKDKYHDGAHHKLLLNFVNELMENYEQT